LINSFCNTICSFCFKLSAGACISSGQERIRPPETKTKGAAAAAAAVIIAIHFKAFSDPYKK